MQPRDYHIAVHYRNYPTEVHELEFPNLSAALDYAALTITYPNDVLYVVVLPC